MKPITSIAQKLGVPRKFLELYGDYKAKISLDILKGLKSGKNSKYVVVTGITPTHFGEGKTVTTIGLSMALNAAGKKAIATLRQPSLGPFFGIKGGGVGGGKSYARPVEDISIHLTGDIHDVEASHNLCASFLDNHLFRGNKLNIDTRKIFWHRVMDVNDRSLRSVRTGLGGGENGFERDSRFDITAASEIMAILALTDSFKDLRNRLGRVVVALDNKGRPVTAEDLKVAGAMTVLLRDAIKPNLVQTCENTPCLIHTGPFANITHGNSSILADKMGLGLADYVVTESGFGADCGFEKFADIKCRASGYKPNAAVLVCSIRALKTHSGRFKIVPGRSLDLNVYEENMEALEEGCANLVKQIGNVRQFGVPCIVAINRFSSDTAKEINYVKSLTNRIGAFDCVVSDVFSKGSKGGMELARSVIAASSAKVNFKFLYEENAPIKDKIATIARKMYGAKGVRFEPLAEESIARFQKLGFGKLPICMAKTHLSLSHDPHLRGAPADFILPVRGVRPSIGAGFLYALCGKILTMPGLPSEPIGEKIDIDSRGRMRYVS